MSLDAITILLTLAAVARLTRLITDDDFPPIAWARERLTAAGERDGAHGVARALADLIQCPWCVSVYVAAGVVLALEWGMSLVLLVIPTASLVGSWLTLLYRLARLRLGRRLIR